jgi:hypothetical protein
MISYRASILVMFGSHDEPILGRTLSQAQVESGQLIHHESVANT